MELIENVIYRGQSGDFDYLAEVGNVEIIEIFEDGITFINLNGEQVTENCTFEGNAAIVKIWN